MPSSLTLALIEAPSNLGLKTPPSGITPGVDRLPAWFYQHGLHERLGLISGKVIEAPAYTGQLEPETGVRQAHDIINYSTKLAREIHQNVIQPKFSLVLGGDCSILVGCLLGLSATTSYGLFFLDGHTDFAWPGLSQTGGAAGMDLALVTGYGPSTLTNIDNRRPYIREKQVFSVGNRYVNDPAYTMAIQSSAITYWPLTRLREESFAQCTDNFLQLVQEQQLAGFWIHLDVDVLDDTLMPAVDSRQPGGLSYDELLALLTPLLTSGRTIGMDITILDPNLDPDGRYVRQFIDELQPIWSQLTTSSHSSE